MLTHPGQTANTAESPTEWSAKRERQQTLQKVLERLVGLIKDGELALWMGQNGFLGLYTVGSNKSQVHMDQGLHSGLAR